MMTTKQNNINEKHMSLGDHLEELRARAILALIGVAICTIGSLCFGKILMKVITWPYEEGIRHSKYSYETVQKINIETKETITLTEDDIISGKDHLNDDEVGKFEIIRTRSLLENAPKLTGLDISEKMLTYFKTSLLFGLLVSSPWVVYQIWAFIAAGLYENEKKYVKTVVPISVTLFISGAAFFLLVIAPMAVNFLINFEIGTEITDSPRLRDYISFVSTLTLVFGLGFQLPIAIITIVHLGIVKIQTLTAIRKYVLLGLVFVSAVLTPPDVISQLALATPLYVLYEASIIACKIKNRKKK